MRAQTLPGSVPRPDASRLAFAPAAFIFDLDGTLVDTEPLFEASEEAYLASYGIEIDEELRHELFGRSAAGFFEILEGRFPGSALNALPLERRLEAKTRLYFERARGRIRTFPALERLARDLSRLGHRLAIASSSTHEIIDFELEAVGLSALFPLRVSAVDVLRGKPEPDIFLETARRLDVDCARCLVFEDSALGLRAAKSAGAFCVALPAPGSDLGRFAEADLLVEGGPAAADARLLLELCLGGGS